MQKMANHAMMNIENTILVMDLPPCLITAAEEKIYEFINPDSVSFVLSDQAGLKMEFKGYDPVRKAISKRFLDIEGVRYYISLLVTPITIHGIAPFVNIARLCELIGHWGEIHNVYKEEKFDEDNKNYVETGNYRVNIAIPDSKNYVPPKRLKLPETGDQFAVTLHCRQCLGSGHIWYECSKQKDYYRNIKRRKRTNEAQTSSETCNKMNPLGENCSNSLMSRNDQSDEEYFDKDIVLEKQVSNENAEDKTGIENDMESMISPNLFPLKKECLNLCETVINESLANFTESAQKVYDKLKNAFSNKGNKNNSKSLKPDRTQPLQPKRNRNVSVEPKRFHNFNANTEKLSKESEENPNNTDLEDGLTNLHLKKLVQPSSSKSSSTSNISKTSNLNGSDSDELFESCTAATELRKKRKASNINKKNILPSQNGSRKKEQFKKLNQSYSLKRRNQSTQRKIPAVNNSTSVENEPDHNKSKKVSAKSKIRNTNELSSAGPSSRTDSSTTEIKIKEKAKASNIKRKTTFLSQNDLLLRKQFKKLKQSNSPKRRIQNTQRKIPEINNGASVANEPDHNKSEKVSVKSKIRNIDGSSSAGPSSRAVENKTSNFVRKQTKKLSEKKGVKRKTLKTRQKKVKITKGLTPGLFNANKKTKHIMQPKVFIEFLNRVRRRKHARVIAREFANSIDSVILKIKKVLALFESGNHGSSEDNAEARVLKDLERRLLGHEHCLTCSKQL